MVAVLDMNNSVLEYLKNNLGIEISDRPDCLDHLSDNLKKSWEISFGTETNHGIEVTRKINCSGDRSSIQFLEIVKNLTADIITHKFSLNTNLSPESLSLTVISQKGDRCASIYHLNKISASSYNLTLEPNETKTVIYLVKD
jgi:hypothetical protein